MFSVLLGVLSSLVATIIWVIFTQLYDFNAKKNINMLLELLCDCAEQFDTAMEFSDCSMAELQADKIIEYCKEIFMSIKFFTYFPKKKKLILTLLYNTYYTISIYKRVWVGYDGEQEKNARLSKFKRKYYYKVKIYDLVDGNLGQEISFLIITCEILHELNNHCSVSKALKDNFYLNEHTTKKIDTYIKLIASLNYKCKCTHINKYDLRCGIFYKEEYVSYLKKLLQEEPTNEQQT